MKKKNYVVALCLLGVLCVASCGKKDEEIQNETLVEIVNEVESEVESSNQSEEKDQMTEAYTTEQESADMLSIGKTRTALSDSGVEANPDAIFSDIPDGIAPEFTYFLFDNVEGMVKAQQYLEKIGVSEEDKKIVVYQKPDYTGANMNFFVISFENGKTYRQDFYFASGQGSFNSIINDYIKEYEQADSDAMYVCTEKREYPTTGSYEEEIQYYEGFGDMYTIAE